MAIVITDVLSEYGSYYLNHGQNTQNLFKKLYRGSETAQHFRTIPTKETVYRVGSAALTRVLQPFQKAFTPIGTLTFKPNAINLFQLKIDQNEYPDDIVDSWLGFLEGEGIDRAAWPFVRWMIEEHVIPQAQEDFELNEVFKGVFAAPTPGTAGNASTAMNGIKKVIADYVTASRANSVAMGAVPSDPEDFCTYVEDYVKAIPEILRRVLDKVFMSMDLQERYAEGKRLKYNLNYQQTDNLATIFHNKHITTIGLPSMAGSNQLWTTTAANRVRPQKKAGIPPTVKEFSARAVSMYTDWWEAVGFLYPEFVYKTDQA